MSYFSDLGQTTSAPAPTVTSASAAAGMKKPPLSAIEAAIKGCATSQTVVSTPLYNLLSNMSARDIEASRGLLLAKYSKGAYAGREHCINQINLTVNEALQVKKQKVQKVLFLAGGGAAALLLLVFLLRR